MSYTPTTEQIRTEWVESCNGSDTNKLHAGASFDRWLAEHDREVAARTIGDVWAEIQAIPHWTNGETGGFDLGFGLVADETGAWVEIKNAIETVRERCKHE